MTDSLSIYRDGSLIASDVRCRSHANRLFAEPADPYDANVRSMAEWGFTVPKGTDVRVGDRIVCTTQSQTLDLIVGEVVRADTWEVAVRIWANKPKTATERRWIVLVRGGVELPPQYVQVVFDRNELKYPPLRYSPAAEVRYKGGWLIGDLDFDVQTEDTFTLDGYAGVISHVLPAQPQRKEAFFMIDMSGVR